MYVWLGNRYYAQREDHALDHVAWMMESKRVFNSAIEDFVLQKVQVIELT
jgi:hypothetical protein